ncbi:MAG: hypothetical protein FWH35_09185, partial [Treponema sp.]|nr:hypothetical protein [Treponema sp.]
MSLTKIPTKTALVKFALE